MRKLQRVRTRRQLLRITSIGAASFPFLALTRKSAWAQRPAPQPSPVPAPAPRPGDQSCFLKGTMISTPSGERPVQELQIGDEVRTLAGRKTIKWIGYNKFTKGVGRDWQDSVMPVRVTPFAFDDRAPCRDLYVSPGHCVFFNEVLIPVKYLVNEVSIAQGTRPEMSSIEYYHVELDTHEVIYAEGALVETYDGWNRDNFSNFVQYERLYGTECHSEMRPFAPVVRYQSRRQELHGLVRSLISNVVDVRDPIQIAYDQLARRAEAMLV
jgi:hypothetical protein